MSPGAGSRRAAVALSAVGAIFLAMAMIQPRVMKNGLEKEIAEIKQLDVELRAIYGEYVNAPTRADSSARYKQIQERDVELLERTLLLPARHEAMQTWWRPGGTGTIVFGIGGALLLAGAVLTLVSRRNSHG